MKRRINIIEDGKVTKTIVKNERNLLHFEVQKNTRASIIKNKKIYTRKAKYKSKNFDL